MSLYIETSRQLFNSALEQRVYACKASGKGFTLYDQYKQLAVRRKIERDLAKVPSEVCRDGIRRLDYAFKNFFRRCRDGDKKKGFPRFKPVSRYNSFAITSPQKYVINGRIKIPGIKKPICCRGLRVSPYIPKRLTIIRRGRSWFAHLLIDDQRPAPPKKLIETSVGLDMGLNSFLTANTGEKVDCPKHYRRLQRKLRGVQRAVSRSKTGSNRRKKKLIRLQAVHGKIVDCRDDFTHRLSRRLVDSYDLIAVEKLNIRGMVRSNLAKSILDAAWSSFLYRLSYKAESAGKTFIQVDPRNTSQECYGCGQIVTKGLSDRVHACLCGCVLDRDVNAARNVLKRAQLILSTPLSGNDGVRHIEEHKTLDSSEAVPLKCAGSC